MHPWGAGAPTDDEDIYFKVVDLNDGSIVLYLKALSSFSIFIGNDIKNPIRKLALYLTECQFGVIPYIEQRNREDHKDLGSLDLNPPSQCSKINVFDAKEEKTMLAPSIFEEKLFDNLFNFPDFRELNNMERKLYGRHADRLMKTDVKEEDNQYEVSVDLPGFAKEDINLELNDGYLTISASKNMNNDKNDKKGRLIRQERYSGSMQRSFYVGDQITEEDVKAAFHHGVLTLTIPKKEQEKLPEKKHIMIA